MAINSNQSYFSRLDENMHLKNMTKIRSHYQVRPHFHDGWQCFNSPSSNFCHFHNNLVVKGLDEKTVIVSLSSSSSSHFNIKKNDFDFYAGFHELINSRLDYLEKLKHIGDDWVSGGSVQPPLEAINFAKGFLKNIRTFVASDNCKVNTPPRIIMSPIPKGGVSIELYFNNELNFLVNIFQNSITLEKEECGYYSEFNVDVNNTFDKIVSEYNNYELIKS